MQIQKGYYQKQEGPGPGFWVGIYRFVTHNIVGFVAAAVFFHSTSYWVGKIEYSLLHGRNTVKQGHYQNPQELQIFIETKNGEIVPYYGTKDNKIPVGEDLLPYGMDGTGYIQHITGKEKGNSLADRVTPQENDAWRKDTRQFLETEAALSQYHSQLAKLKAENDSLKDINGVLQDQQDQIPLEERLRTEFGLSPGEVEAVMRLKNQ